MKTQDLLLPAAAFGLGIVLAKRNESSINGIGYTGNATLKKTLVHLAKAEQNIWESGLGWTLPREQQIKAGEARVALIEIIEANGYKIDYDTRKIYKV